MSEQFLNGTSAHRPIRLFSAIHSFSAIHGMVDLHKIWIYPLRDGQAELTWVDGHISR